MAQLLLALLITLSVTGCAARQNATATPAARDSVSETSVRAHMEFLASDALNGRGSGTRDEWIAASYIGSHFQRWGLEPLGDNGFVQEVRVERGEVVAAPTLAFAGQRVTHAKEMLVTAFATARTLGPLQKYQSGTAVTPGAVVLLPATNPPDAGETARASMVLSLETPQL